MVRNNNEYRNKHKDKLTKRKMTVKNDLHEERLVARYISMKRK